MIETDHIHLIGPVDGSGNGVFIPYLSCVDFSYILSKVNLLRHSDRTYLAPPFLTEGTIHRQLRSPVAYRWSWDGWLLSSERLDKLETQPRRSGSAHTFCLSTRY